MQKWQQKQRQKAHESIVQNAKSSFKRYSNSRQKSINASRAKQSSYTSTINKNQMQIPINKILQIFQLAKYASLLSSYRLMQNLVQLQNLSDQNLYIKEITEQVQHKDKERFQSLLHTLFVMSKNLKSSQKLPKNRQNPRNMYYPPPPSTSLQNHQTPTSMPKTNKSQSKFRIKVKNNPHNTPKTLTKNVHQQSIKSTYSKQKQIETQILSNKTKKRRKSVNITVRSKGKSSDDLTLIHNFQLNSKQGFGQLKCLYQSNKIVKKLAERLSYLQPTNKNSSNNQQDIQLQMDKVKQMYLSFDSATLTSNINNIDLQQLTYCFSMQIISILVNCQVQDLAKTNENKIKSLLRQSFIIVKQEQRQSKTQFDSLHESKLQNYVNPQNVQINNNHMDYSQQIQQLKQIKKLKQPSQFQDLNQVSEEISETENGQNVQIKLKQEYRNNGLASSIWGNNYIASVINDFSCFDNNFFGQCFQKQPKVDDVKNFVDLIMMAGKMEKQIPILAYVYIDRLLKQVKGSKLTKRNWRNVILITLIQASKIWDDRSLQNHSFSKVIQPYTTLQINRLEKYLLFFIDYRLNINQKQYSQSYFSLRKHSNSPFHTVNLIRLDLRTINKLQNIENCQEKEKIQKKQFMRKCMDKSF